MSKIPYTFVHLCYGRNIDGLSFREVKKIEKNQLQMMRIISHEAVIKSSSRINKMLTHHLAMGLLHGF